MTVPNPALRRGLFPALESAGPARIFRHVQTVLYRGIRALLYNISCMAGMRRCARPVRATLPSIAFVSGVAADPDVPCFPSRRCAAISIHVFTQFVHGCFTSCSHFHTQLSYRVCRPDIALGFACRFASFLPKSDEIIWSLQIRCFVRHVSRVPCFFG